MYILYISFIIYYIIIMVLLTTGIILSNNNKIINNVVKYDNIKVNLTNNIYIIIFISFVLLCTTMPAVLVALQCNPNNKILYGLIGFFFSDIYMIQWSIKKFILKKENYCKKK